MARKEATLGCCALTQQLEKEHWAWGAAQPQTLDDAKAGNVMPLLDRVVLLLGAAGMVVAEAHAILHDEDDREVWNESECALVLERKALHVHIVVKFEPGKGGTLDKIADAVGLLPQYVEKAGKGRYGWDNLLSYLIHAKDEDKHQYSPDKVASIGPKSYKAYAMEHKAEWEKGRAAKTRAKAEESIDELEAKILEGQVTKSQIILTDRYYSIYARYKRRCDDAFEIYGERRAYKTIQALQDGDFKLTVFFITGQAGAGKTRFSKRFVDAIADYSAQGGGDRWRICQTAATNPLDDYTGEEILFMDDVRGGSLSASDWLKLLDPYNISPGSARYHNKVPACRCIVITSSKDPLEFFYYAKQIGGDRSEALDQFMRRIQSTVRVIHADEFTQYRIADSQRTEPRMVPAPGGSGLMVRLSYGFGEEQVYDEAAALAYLVSKVDANSGLVEKGRLADEAAEAAAGED